MGNKIHVGRPIKYSNSEKTKLLRELAVYVEAEEYPTLPKFCVAHGISKQRVYEWAKDEKLSSEGKNSYPLGEYFTELIKRMSDKQESFIEEHVMQGHIAPSFAMFKLKQPGIGWLDSKSVELTGEVVDARLKEIMYGSK
ncbi:MAG: DNA-packaging protein [Treponema sp.]|jgi:hypothetical protein|nr:DNA-packaging protein [Treponema sp.]